MREVFFNIDDEHFKVWLYDYNPEEYRVVLYNGQVNKPLEKLRQTPVTFQDDSEAEKYINNKKRGNGNRFSQCFGKWFSQLLGK